jgi:hypothetical protein
MLASILKQTGGLVNAVEIKMSHTIAPQLVSTTKEEYSGYFIM